MKKEDPIDNLSSYPSKVPKNGQRDEVEATDDEMTAEETHQRHRRPDRHAQIHLPPLDPDEALRFVAFLDRISRGIWRAHGMQMGECLVDRHISHTASPIENNDFDLPF